MPALNPNHPVIKAVEDHWHKLCAIAMFKLGANKLDIKLSDLEEFAAAQLSIVVHGKGEVLSLSLVSPEEAQRILRQAGGRPH